MDEEQESEDVAIQHLRKHIDALEPDVYAVRQSKDGELLSVSKNPDDDEMTCVYYPPLQTLPANIKTVFRSELVELDRLTPNVDLTSYAPYTSSTETRKVVFKYYFLLQFLDRVWHEMNLWMRLPPHPHIAPFDRVVLYELHGHVVGCTNLYIPGGTISENKSRVFKLEWLQQLTRVVDDLNLKHGIDKIDRKVKFYSYYYEPFIKITHNKLSLLVIPKHISIYIFRLKYEHGPMRHLPPVGRAMDFST